jgi:hypothetical protein
MYPYIMSVPTYKCQKKKKILLDYATLLLKNWQHSPVSRCKWDRTNSGQCVVVRLRIECMELYLHHAICLAWHAAYHQVQFYLNNYELLKKTVCRVRFLVLFVCLHVFLLAYYGSISIP